MNDCNESVWRIKCLTKRKKSVGRKVIARNVTVVASANRLSIYLN